MPTSLTVEVPIGFDLKGEWANWLAWLELSKPEAELLRSLPAGSLSVEQAR